LRQGAFNHQHPDDFLATLTHDSPRLLAGIAESIARAWADNVTTADVLDSLAIEARTATGLIRASIRSMDSQET
jgi:hypothetical protein